MVTLAGNDLGSIARTLIGIGRLESCPCDAALPARPSKNTLCIDRTGSLIFIFVQMIFFVF
jgi:hypothetical protein